MTREIKSMDPTGKSKEQLLVELKALKSNESDLQKSAKIYQTVFENSAVAITVTDDQERIISWNPFTEQMLGRSRDDLYLKPIHALYPEAEWKRIRSLKIRELGAHHNIETQMLKGNGGLLDVDVSISVLKDNDGKVIGSIGITRDISERKRAEFARKNSEEKFRTVFENSAIAITVTDDQERIVSWNKFAESLLGFNRNDLYLKHISCLYPREEWERIRSLRLRWKGKEHHFESKMKTKYGDPIDVDISVSVLKDANGKVLGSIGVTQNITDRKQAELALKLSEEKFRTVFENSAVAITVSDDKERIVSWNYFTEMLLDKGRDDLYLKPLSSLYPAHEWKKIRSLNIREKGIIHSLETKMIGKDGIPIDVDISISVLKDSDGKVTGSIGVTRDIAARKKAEHEMRLAKDLALETARAKSAFLANMSHEIRTPMNGVMSMLELVLDTVLTREQREDLETAKSSADSLVGLVNDILDFSKIEAGKLELESSEFSLRELIASLIKMFLPSMRSKGLELLFQVSREVPEFIIGDSARLRQIITNLISNAIKFTSEGEVRVQIELDGKAKNEVSLRVMVSDTGIGIPKDQQKKIFDPFIQEDNSTTRKYGGTGLGLSISSQLVKMMGGRIWIESPSPCNKSGTGGPGSLFHFTADFQVQEGKIPETGYSEIVSNGHLSILIVDHNPTSRRSIENMMGSLNIELTTADSGSSAIAELVKAERAGKPFNFAIIDSEMPGIDGFTLAEWISKSNDIKQTKIILLIANENQKVFSESLGASSVLLKPVQQLKLLDVIRQKLSIQRQGKVLSKHENRSQFQVTNHEKGRILLAEDNLVNQRAAVRLLEKQGYEVEIAENGKQVLQKLAQKNFDVVLMDVQMPEMDGFEATKAIRIMEKKSGKHTPIIALTAHAMKEDRVRCLREGMDAYVSKPVRWEELFKVIEEQKKLKLQNTHQAKNTHSVCEKNDIVSKTEAIEHMGRDEEIYRDVVEVFLRGAPEQVKQLREAIEMTNQKEVERYAHSLKSSAAMLGAHALKKEAYQIEMAAKQNDLSKAGVLFLKLEVEFEKVKTYLLKSAA
jgi:two-component system, sensor histidine kinase and response regulator